MPILPVTAASLARAASALRRGGIVAFPTETVYGLAVDAGNPAAVDALRALKGREENKPFQVLVPSLKEAEKLAHFNPEAARLAGAFWPGALTLVLPRRATAKTGIGVPTLGLRCPDHEATQALLAAFGKPLAATSANPAGAAAAVTAEGVVSGFRFRVSGVMGTGSPSSILHPPSSDFLILDGGACRIGLASTVVECTGGNFRILREGAISAASLAAYR